MLLGPCVNIRTKGQKGNLANALHSALITLTRDPSQCEHDLLGKLSSVASYDYNWPFPSTKPHLYEAVVPSIPRVQNERL